MSRRRKNAGEGYGYMFHGAFAKKADAVKKERKTKGAWVKFAMTKHGARYLVMSPRTNPIKRRKKKAKPIESYAPRVPAIKGSNGWPEQNPSELIVMGANPSNPGEHKELNLPAGSTITIRVNPEPRENLYLGFGPSHPSKKELAASRRAFKSRVRQRVKEDDAHYTRLRKSARAGRKDKKKLESLFHELYGRDNPICGAMIGGYRCTRKPGHRGPHLPQGATLRPRSRHHWGPRGNPSAEALREKFVGAPVDRTKVFDEPHMPAGNYASLGKLLKLYVKPRSGGQVLQIAPQDNVTIVADETARQIYFVGGDQDVSAALPQFGASDRGAGLFELGEARRIDYRQRKEHVPHPESDQWRHEFGEESGIRPKVLFDAKAKRLLLDGGDYKIEEAGIIN